MIFKKNVGLIDAILRIGIGAGLIYTGFIATDLINDNIASTLLGVFGIFILTTGVFGYCPLYNLISFNSRSENTEE